MPYVRRNPNIEFGGYIFIDHSGNSQLNFVTIGDEHSVPLPPLSPDDFDRDKFHALVRWHSHPRGTSFHFSEKDVQSFNHLVNEFNIYLNNLLFEGWIRPGFFSVYDAVINTSNRINWAGRSFEIIGGGMIPVRPQFTKLDVFAKPSKEELKLGLMQIEKTY